METVTTKPLGKSDVATISELDKLSGFHVLEWVEDFSGWNDESLGLKLGGKLFGYCTIGYADNECPVITDHELWTPDSYQLSDVFILPACRHRGYGSKMVKEAIGGRYVSEGKRPVFLQVLNEKLQTFYRAIGFSRISNAMGYHTMVFPPDNQI